MKSLCELEATCLFKISHVCYSLLKDIYYDFVTDGLEAISSTCLVSTSYMKSKRRIRIIRHYENKIMCSTINVIDDDIARGHILFNILSQSYCSQDHNIHIESSLLGTFQG